ncbi:peptidase inhibitor family I36 protein [Nakamurella sp. GG22]
MAFLLVAFLLSSAFAVVGTPALAASRDGRCDRGEFCYYYNSNLAGSVSDFTKPIGDYGTRQPRCYDFKGPGKGQGKCIKNNAASVWNRTSRPITVYNNTGYRGKSQIIKPGAKVNLTSLKNRNASHKFGATPPRPPACPRTAINSVIPHSTVGVAAGMGHVVFEGTFWTALPCGANPSFTWLRESNYGLVGWLDCREGEVAPTFAQKIDGCYTTSERGALQVRADVTVEQFFREWKYSIVMQVEGIENGQVHSRTTVNGKWAMDTWHGTLSQRPL